jgi:L-alanine-DL-glutamate epimerase-like enolase superfamily enzyme
MRITGFRAQSYTMQLDRPIGDANCPAGVDLVPGSIIYVDTDEDISGVSLGFGGASVATLFQALEGADPREVVGLWIKMNDLVHKTGNEGEANFALSALDIALWDLKAKLADEPLWRTLGGREGRVRAYASGLDYCLSDDELFAFYRRMAERGVAAGKLKAGLDVEADMRRLAIMQEALSIAAPHPQLMIDVNEYWSPKQAVRYVCRMEERFDLVWVEEPARRWDYDGLRLVRAHISAAIATGENVNSVADIYPLIANDAVDVINISQLHSGVTGCRQIASLAHVYGVSVSMMNCQANFMAHVAAALPNHGMMEVADPGREQCVNFDNWIEDGCIVLGAAPGFGIRIDELSLARLQANPPTGTARFPFPRRAGAGRYVVPPSQDEVPWRLGP